MAAAADDVTDPSDWPQPDFAHLDGLLRCTICYEFFRTPVMFQGCSHNCTAGPAAPGTGRLLR